MQRYGIGAQSFDFLLDTIALATPGAANVNQVFLDFILVPSQVIVNASDSAGNLSTCAVNVTVIDAVAPIIECANDTAVDNVAGLCGATVTYHPLNFTDNCGATIAQVGGLGSGSFFPWAIQWKHVAIDSFGNTDAVRLLYMNETSQLIHLLLCRLRLVEVNGVFYTVLPCLLKILYINGCDSVGIYS